MNRYLPLVLVFALTLAFASCGPSEPSRYSTTYATEVKTLNYFMLLDNTALRVAANTMDGLVENDRFGRFVPSLAESWTSNADFTEWTFTLRSDVPWIDQTGAKTPWTVKAKDFVDGFKYVADPANGIKNFGTVRKLIKGANAYYLDLLDIADGVDIGKTRDEVLASFDSSVGVVAKDDKTLVYTLANPTPYFISYLVTELFYPLQAEYMAQVGVENFGTTRETLISNGAYYLSSWQRDKEIVLTQSSHYWDKASIKIPEISLQKVADPAVTVQMFQRTEVSSATLGGDQVKALQGTKWQDLIVLSEKSAVNFWFAMNFTTANPEAKAFINNVNFRKALYHGIDRAKLNELDNPFEPQVLLRNTIVPEGILFDEAGVDYTDYPELAEVKARNTYDPDLARDYLAKAIAELTDGAGTINGVSPGAVDMKPIAELAIDGKLPLQMLFVHSNDPTDTRLALLLQAMIKDVFKGQVELVLGQFVDDKYNDVVEPRRFDLVYDSFRFGFGDPMAQLGRLVTDGAVNDGQYSDPTFDELVSQANTKTISSERYELFAKAERLMIDNAYIIPWRSGGGVYTMSNIVPFTAPRGGFGTTRYRFKGMELSAEPITVMEYRDREAAFKDAISKL